MLGITSEESHNVLHGQLANCLTAFDSSIRKLAFCFLKIQDPLFNCIGDGETIDHNINGLIQTMDTVNGLFFNKLQSMLALLRW